MFISSIHTLISDIYAQLDKRGGWFSSELATEFATETARRLQEQFVDRTHRGLRLSKMKPTCPSQLWYSYHHPELEEPVTPWATNKFCYGHILEAWAICLAKAAGHRVEGEQDELVVCGVSGHRDCVIDGCVVDVKSCNSRTFAKFKNKSVALVDDFGWLDQLDGYMEGSIDDPLVLDKTHAYLLAIDKEMGHMVLYQHEFRPGRIPQRIKEARATIERSSAPKCTCGTVPDGKSGNYKLDTVAKYNPFKWQCFPRLRAFLYSDGLRHLSRVEYEPDVPELNREGKIIRG